MFEKYREYKDSDVEWIGMMPKNWGIQRLKNFFKQRGSLFVDGDWIESKDIGGDDVNYFTTGNIGELQFRKSDPSFITTETFKKLRCTKVEVNDILISRLNVPLGRCCLAPKTERPAIVSVDVVICRPDDTFNRKYYVYVMNSPLYFSFSEIESRGAIMKRISRSILGNFYFPVPPLAEQTAIANFLDRKTAQIDKAISIKEKQIELLKERRQILIHNAVTRGLDPGVKMKDSGVEWIGEIPEHWEVKKVKYLFHLIGGGTPSKERSDFWNGDIPWVSPKDMKSDHIISTEDNMTMKGLVNSSSNFIQENTLLMVVRSGILQRTIPVAISKVGLTINQDMKAFIPTGLMNSEFLFYFIKGNDTFLKNDWVKQGATVESVEAELLKNGMLPVPPIPKQEEIVLYVKGISKKIETVLSLKQKEIEKLKEYKSTLINSAVTGKIKVS